MSGRVSCRSREDLLAWLDGELSPWTRVQISRHLRGCWECRNRAADLTDTIRSAASAISTSAPPQTQVSKAKWRFHEKAREYEATLDRHPAKWRRKQGLMAGLSATAAIAAVFAMPAIVGRRPSAPVPAVPRTKPAAQPRPVAPPAVGAVAVPVDRPLTPESALPVLPRLPLTDPVTVDPGALDRVEIAVRSLLHRSRLCLSGDIAVRRTDRAVEISGMAPNEDRKRQLLALFSAVRPQELLQLRVQTVPETPLPDATPLSEAVAIASEAPAENWLRARMRVGDAATQREMFDVMNGIVSNAQGLLAEVWAVRRLAERYPGGTESALPEAERLELRAMAEDHVIAAEAHIAAIGELLRPLGIALPAGSASPAPDDWQSGALTLQRGVAESAASLLTLFTAGSEGAPAIAGDSEISRAAIGLSEARELIGRERGRLSPLVESDRRRP